MDENGLAVSGADVTVLELGLTGARLWTDYAGHCTYTLQQDAPYQIRAGKAGFYQTVESEIDARSVRVRVVLTHEQVVVEQVNVTASVPGIDIKQTSDTSTMNTPEIVSVRGERRRVAGTIPPRCVSKNRMEPWPLPKARPISCNDTPAFQRRHMPVLCSAESLSHFPCVINTTFRKMIHIRWCCIDQLSWQGIAVKSPGPLILSKAPLDNLVSSEVRPFINLSTFTIFPLPIPASYLSVRARSEESE